MHPTGLGPRPVRSSRHEPESSVRAPEERLSAGRGRGWRAAQREPGLSAHGLGARRRRLPAASAASIPLLPLLVSAGAAGGWVLAAPREAVRSQECRNQIGARLNTHVSFRGLASLGWDPRDWRGACRSRFAPSEQVQICLPMRVRPRSPTASTGHQVSGQFLHSGCYTISSKNPSVAAPKAWSGQGTDSNLSPCEPMCER